MASRKGAAAAAVDTIAELELKTSTIAELEAEVAALKAANWGAGIEIRDLKAKLNVANEQIHMIMQQPNAAPSNGGNDDVVAIPLFEAIDANGDGVLTREEFTEGYSRFISESASATFDAIDANSDGELTREEFQQGYALLVSDTARGERERERVERAVAAERIRATKEAALVLAEAELMDVLDASIKSVTKLNPTKRRNNRPTRAESLKRFVV